MARDTGLALTLIFLAHLCLKIWAASEVCSRLIEDRRSGALELLLTSPLSVREIADGQSVALRRIFGWPVGVLIAAEIVLMLLLSRRAQGGREAVLAQLFFLVAISTLLGDMWAIKWTGLWLSLRGKSIERVLVKTLGRILLVPWVVAVAVGGVTIMSRTFTGAPLDPSAAIFGWWLNSLGFCALFGFSARSSFLQRFRAEASERFGSGGETQPRKGGGRRRKR